MFRYISINFTESPCPYKPWAPSLILSRKLPLTKIWECNFHHMIRFRYIICSILLLVFIHFPILACYHLDHYFLGWINYMSWHYSKPVQRQSWMGDSWNFWFRFVSVWSILGPENWRWWAWFKSTKSGKKNIEGEAKHCSCFSKWWHYSTPPFWTLNSPSQLIHLIGGCKQKMIKDRKKAISGF